ncbi:MAG: phytoene desaturase [Prolixibacteraceae bacterium]|nr:phytoene desaturase [Prolixibacteraceae bacterium]
MTRTIIIGSGIAGLASAIRMARRGHSVQLFEASDRAGGKIAERRLSGFRFDAGPSLLTLPELVLELLDDDLQFSVRRLEVITNYFWEDNTQLKAWNDVDKLSQEISDKLGVSPEKVKSYLRKSATVYDLTADLFIFGSFHRLKNLLNRKSLKTLLNIGKLKAFKSLHQFNTEELEHPKLVQLFDRYATYNGSNPYQTPATLSVISHLEHNLGAYIPENGMFQITDSLVRQSERLGVSFHLNEPVLKVEYSGGEVRGVHSGKGFYDADVVISDVDIHRFYSSLMPDAQKVTKIEKEERSSSALIFYWGMNGTFPELDVHNIFFSDRYEEEFRHLFSLKTAHSDPTVYIYISSKYNKSDAPEGGENWFVMVNAPADVGQNWDELIPQMRQYILEKLERMLKTSLSGKIVAEEILSPPEIWELTGSVNGSLYGSSSNSRYASFNRHPNFRKDIRGLYFVGGSVHPGGGIPLCLSSARIVEGLVSEQFQK